MAEVVQMPIASLDERYRALRLMGPEVLGALRRSVERHGLLQPLVANLLSDGTAVLLDGFKRVEVLREGGATEVAVRAVHLTAEQAEAAILAYNAPHRGLSELEEAWIVRSLSRTHGLKQARIAELLGRHKSWVCRRLALAERLALTVQDDMRLGLVSATAARELVRLPRGNQAQVALAVREHGLASRDVHRLVELWLAADEEGREALLADPARYVKRAEWTPRPLARDPRLSPEAEAVRQSLGRLEEAAHRFGQTTQRHLPLSLGPEQTAILAVPLSRAHTEVKAALGQLVQLCSAWLADGWEQQREAEARVADVRGGAAGSSLGVETGHRQGLGDRPTHREEALGRGGATPP